MTSPSKASGPQEFHRRPRGGRRLAGIQSLDDRGAEHDCSDPGFDDAAEGDEVGFVGLLGRQHRVLEGGVEIESREAREMLADGHHATVPQTGDDSGGDPAHLVGVQREGAALQPWIGSAQDVEYGREEHVHTEIRRRCRHRLRG
ncbi:hypothetical protein SUDANB51_06638 [Streptomyces sp. enrichment culture]